MTRHEQLLDASEGYRAWVADYEEDCRAMFPEDPDPLCLVRGFAEWLTAGSPDLEEWAGWTAEEFQEEWEHWNS